jgi:HEAT repeat protein
MSSEEAMPDLVEALSTDPDDTVREYAAETLARIGGPAVIGLLPEMIKHVTYPWDLLSETLGYEYAAALGNDRIKIKTWSAAVKRLGVLGEPELTEELKAQIEGAIADLDSDRWKDRRKAEDTLRSVGLPAKAALEKAHEEGSLTVQYAAKQLLQELGVWLNAKEFVETQALGENLIFLIMVLSESDEEMVKAARETLKKKTGKEFATQREWLRWYSRDFRK